MAQHRVGVEPVSLIESVVWYEAGKAFSRGVVLVVATGPHRVVGGIILDAPHAVVRAIHAVVRASVPTVATVPHPVVFGITPVGGELILQVRGGWRADAP